MHTHVKAPRTAPSCHYHLVSLTLVQPVVLARFTELLSWGFQMTAIVYTLSPMWLKVVLLCSHSCLVRVVMGGNVELACETTDTTRKQ